MSVTGYPAQMYKVSHNLTCVVSPTSLSVINSPKTQSCCGFQNNLAAEMFVRLLIGTWDKAGCDTKGAPEPEKKPKQKLDPDLKQKSITD